MMSTYLMGALPSKGLTTQALTDIIDTERSTRLEATIVVLIVEKFSSRSTNCSFAWPSERAAKPSAVRRRRPAAARAFGRHDRLSSTAIAFTYPVPGEYVV